MEPVRILRSDGVEPVILFANSNIHPAEEYARRLETLREWAARENVEVAEGAYDAAAWESTVGRLGDAVEAKFGVITGAEGDAARGDLAEGNAADGGAKGSGVAGGGVAGGDAAGGDAARGDAAGGAQRTSARAAREARCRACYRLRFEEAARYARDHGFSALGTTLSVSPYQYTTIIREELERACAREGLEAHFEDYRPYYEEATRRSRAEGLYRQNYCGCRFSSAEAAAEREERHAARQAARAAERAATAEARATEEAERARKRTEKQAYAEKQARKRAVLKALREQAAATDADA